jgi:hypothetical protein
MEILLFLNGLQFKMPLPTYPLFFQWDEPFFSVRGAPGCQVDLDVILYLEQHGSGFTKSCKQYIGQDPVSTVSLNPGQFSNDTMVTVDMVILKRQGASPKLMKMIPFVPIVETKFEFATNSPTNALE